VDNPTRVAPRTSNGSGERVGPDGPGRRIDSGGRVVCGGVVPVSDIEPERAGGAEWTDPGADALRSPYATAAETLAELRRRDRFLFTVALVNAALAGLFTVLMLVDGRTLLGRNVWTKPWKFATSIAVFSATVGWLLPSLSLAERVERRASYIIGTAMLIEITLISGQAARGVRSHFNASTPLDGGVAAAMGLTITVSTLVVVYVLWRILRTRPPLSAPYLWGIRAGMLLFVVASFEGYLMIANGAHSVGVSPSAPGLPVLNWKLTGGDLRIAHFVGLHALQVLPLTGYVASRWDRLSDRDALRVVGGVGALYGLLVAATFVVAMLGNPLVRPLPSMSTVFALSFLLVAPFWLLMIVAPTWRWTERVVDSHLIAVPAAALYVLLVAPQAVDVATTLLSPTLGELTTILSGDVGATVAWVHFLAFDLFVGRWIYLDARDRGVRPLVVSLVLFATLMFGPAGFLAYSVARPAFSDG